MRGARAHVEMVVAVLALYAGAAAADVPAAGTSGTVTLPLGDYDRLVERAARPPKVPDPSPVEAVIGAADLRVRVDGETARGTLRLDGEVFRKGVVKVPLLASSTVTEVKRAGRPVSVVSEGGVHSALLSGPEAFTLEVGLALPVVPQTGGAAVVLPALAAGSTRVSIDVPGSGTEVKVASGTVVGRTSAAGRTTVQVSVEAHQPTRVTWTTREVAAATPHEARWLSDVKTLVTLDEAALRLAVVVDINILQGQPRRFELERPDGFEVVDVSGQTLESSDVSGDRLRLTVAEGALAHHQFLMLLERSVNGALPPPPLLSVAGAQRETGEVAVQGVGTLELTAKEGGTLRRLDVRELSPALRALAMHPILAAFRYHRRSSEPPTLAVEVKRFPDAPVLAAVAERAVVTTLATSQGRRLTEIVLTVRNQAQPFLKVDLPSGVQLLSAEVAGEKVKPVLGSDGTRVPLLRAGFRPTGTYTVSFVYVEAGAAYGRRGESQLSLPKIDVPIELMQWEVFLPDRYRVDLRGGNVLRDEGYPIAIDGPLPVLATAAPPAPPVSTDQASTAGLLTAESIANMPINNGSTMSLLKAVPGLKPGPGEVVGVVLDDSGAPLPGASVTVVMVDTGMTRTTVSGADGTFVLRGLPNGRLHLKTDLQGFKSHESRMEFTGQATVRTTLQIGSLTETITVEAGSGNFDMGAYQRAQREAEEERLTAPSANVGSLQRRVSGVLPIDVEVPHTGTSHRFVRALALGDATTVTFRYKTR